ncbi:hypothetical protein HDU83_003456 [Entophlyctis luteolus]|nr:hypothetical protein HDU83_003456 [Entophlyctis luteolus]
MQQLPFEVLARVLCHLPFPGVFHLRRVARAFIACIDSDWFAALCVHRVVVEFLPARVGGCQWPFAEDAAWFFAPPCTQRMYAKLALSKLQEISLGRFAASYLLLDLFAAPIPTSIGLLTNLKRISFNQMNLVGQLPDSFSCLTDLTHLNLSDNSLTGSLEPLMGLKKLVILDISSNKLDEEIPTSISNLVLLEQLILKNNSIPGRIPAEIGTLSNLHIIEVSRNALTGPIPKEIGKLTKLIHLSMACNRICGQLPETISSLVQVRAINLSENLLTGDLPDLSKLQHLTHLHLSKNGLTSTIPPYIFMHPFLRELNLSHNCLFGQIPDLSEFASISAQRTSRLEFLDLTGNRLSGVIPEDIFRLPMLYGLKLGENMLSGSLPQAITNLRSLVWLHLDSNQLSGTLPVRGMGSLKRLRKLYLKGNRFSRGAVIPEDVTPKSLLWRLLRENGFEDSKAKLGKTSKSKHKHQKQNLERNRYQGRIFQ